MTAAVDDAAQPSAEAPPATPGNALVAVPVQRSSITEKITYAQHLAQSGLLPRAYQKNPANVLYATEYGDMLGLAPMAAITGIHIIEGKPTASAALMSALVRRAGHRLRVTGNDTQATVQIVRSDDPDFTFESVWTIDRARTAGLVGKDVWKKYPAAMLKARALTECARDACEEALMGMHYTPEEMGADVDEDGNPIRVRATAERVGGNVTPINNMDWPAEVAKAEDARDRDKLKELWKLAQIVEPLNEDLLRNITEAGQRVKVVLDAEAAASAEPDPDGAVEAEIVDDALTLAREAGELFDQLMACETPQQVHAIATRSVIGRPVGDVDISGLLTADLREVLALDADTFSLGGLVHQLLTYTEKHQRAAGAPVDDTAVQA